MTEVSIIILAGGHADRLRGCLGSFCRQTQPAEDYEVVVVFSGSSDDTDDTLSDLAVPYKLCGVRANRRGFGVALNGGVEAASGRYCLFLADDVMAHPRLVAEHLKRQRQGGGVIGIGQILLALPQGADGLARYVAQERRDRYAKLDQGECPSYADCGSGNLSLPREAILKAGGFAFDLSGSESIELAYRLTGDGLVPSYIPEAVVTQEYQGGFRETADRIQRAGAASIELYRRHPPMLSTMALGAFNNMSRCALLLRRCLLALSGPLLPLAIIGPSLKHPSWKLAWYRFLRDYCYWRGVRAVVPREMWRRLVFGTTILMYHACGHPGEHASLYVIPGNRFARQMAWLKWTGRPVLSLEAFLQYHREHRLPPPRSIVITFDDGYADNRAIAYPILRRHGFPATIFVVTEMVGGRNMWDTEGLLRGRPLLKWSDLKEMTHGGMSVGSHTKTHIPLADAPLPQIEEEVKGSRVQIERELGGPILSFAYPNGRHDNTSEAAVERAGFAGACSSHLGVNDPATPPYVLRRIEIRGTYSLMRFALALWFGRTHVLPRRWFEPQLAMDHPGQKC
ncbi:MAG: polysaccharide deacetylase family protein [Nitrospira sp.]|jgi:peptidoglycan/xylan/chitin deacetylase (PgdA/CDA1 family)/glycosyltransferase involved in cell wall biosynthesis|nr:polysaccharide deacetylase family protein [Nitrospira sp.]